MEQEDQATSRALPIPLTFSGIVAFSARSTSWLLLSWVCIAAFAATSTVGFLHSRWIPIIEKTAESLPSTSMLEGGRIDPLPTESPIQNQNGFLSVVVSGLTQSHGNLTSDFQITIEPTEIRFSSLFGSVARAYPADATVDLAPAFLKPWWKSRKPLVTVGAFASLMTSLLATWTLLATIYFLPILFLTYCTHRRIGLGKTWRLAGSILIPGALIMTLAIILYGFQLLSILGLMAATALHLIVAWIYAIGSIRAIPRRSPSFPSVPVKGNPFSGVTASEKIKRGSNPFGTTNDDS